MYHTRSFFHADNHLSFSQYSSSIASLETLDIGQLQGGGEEVAAVLKAAADILGAVSTQHHFVSLQALSNDLHKLAADTDKAQGRNSLRSRGLFDAFTSAFTGGAVGGKDGAASGGGGIFEALGGKLLDVSAESLAGPAQYLGDGVGRGATTGLKINNGVKQTSAEKPSGVNKIADNLGFGLSNALTGSLNTSVFTTGAGAASSALGSGLGGGTASGLGLNKSAVVAPNGTGIPGIAGGLGNGLTYSLFSNIDMSKLMSGLPTGMLQSAVVSAGKGLGEGAAEGLDLPMKAATAMRLKRAAAEAAGTNTTGSGVDIGKVAFGFTRSLSSSFLGAVDIKQLTAQAMSGSNLSSMVGPTLVGAGSGLGSGAAQGLGLSSKAVDPTTGPDTAAPEVAHNFAYQLTTSFLANGTLSSLQSKLMSAMSGSSMVGPALVGAGSGLGAGAAQGLGLSDKAQDPTTGPDATAPDVAHNFAYQLTTNFLANGTLPSLQSKLMSIMSMSNISSMLGPAAQGAGSGIGQGAAVGLGLQDPTTAQSPMGGDVAMVARDFSYGLTSNFLANGTVSRLQAKAASLLGGGSNSSTGGMMSALQGISVSKAAEGLARGLVDGAGQSVSNMGGFQAILSGANSSEVMMQAITPIFKSNDFNDTTGGVATSFGQGLGGQGVTLIAQMLGTMMTMASNGNITSTPSGNGTTAMSGNISGNGTSVGTVPSSSSSMGASSSNFSTPNMRSRFVLRRTLPPKVPSSPKLKLDRRVDTSLNISEITSDLITGVNVTSIDILLQKVASRLKASGSIPSMLATGGSSIMLPNATFTIESQDNEFKVNPSTMDITVNGIGINQLTLLIVAHAFLVILAYFIAIPFALLLTSGNEIAAMLGRPHIWAQASKYRFYIWCFGVLPLSLGGLVLGIILLGTASHGKTFHGILGFVAITLTFVAFILEMRFNASIKALRLLRGVVLAALLGAANVAFVTGFVDIQRISLCTVQLPDAVLIGAAMNVASTFTTGTTVVTVKMYIKKWMGREMRGVPGMGDEGGIGMEKSGFEDDKEKVTFKERIRILRG
ncbi:hypothetical protein EYC80_004207 [Monilinia laxa]|uniref:Cytochrome b561 domain-containing protein n=1 Tax=Monilinia laxa TaxID=61186 RepID=A0A5N6KM98_MONLA|nr:hypothetical protein EYC80_004207 [Monilinia laxa]